jgi:hypothetical protein
MTIRDEIKKQYKSETITDESVCICPRYENCNAAYCPFAGGKHLKGEETCHLMREVLKEGGLERIKALYTPDIAERVYQDATRLIDGGTEPINYHEADLRRKLREASLTPSTITNANLDKGIHTRWGASPEGHADTLDFLLAA